jgi:hypothetical protein
MLLSALYLISWSGCCQRPESRRSAIPAMLTWVTSSPTVPPPSGIRYCMNAVALKRTADQQSGANH